MSPVEFPPKPNPAAQLTPHPLPDPIGFSAGTFTLPPSFPTPYFDLPAVKAAINAPLATTWLSCANPATIFATGIDQSINAGPGSQPVLPGIIERTRNVILGHGSRDFLVLPESTLLTIQNLTWLGAMGFQRWPVEPLFVPYHDNADVRMASGAGVVGTSHTERGLTWFEAALAGHLVAADQPAVAFRMVEVLLGRVEGLESTVPFTVEMGGVAGPVGELGTGTVKVGAGRRMFGLGYGVAGWYE